MRPSVTTSPQDRYECPGCGTRVVGAPSRVCAACGGRLVNIGRPRDL